MLLCTVQALGELAVLFPINGAFYTYVVRFVDPSLYVTFLLPREFWCALLTGV
jgi:amino acid permease